MPQTVDLHSHTHYSDGAHAPGELVRRARAAGIDVLAITDHDSVDAWDEAVEEGRRAGVELIAGVELSATLGRKDVHILGYMFDPHNREFRDILSLLKRERRMRAERIVEKLHDMKLPLPFESVLAYAGLGAIGRPHIAAALVDNGYTSTYAEAFVTLIGDSCPAFEPKYRIAPEHAVEIIANAGGVSILAHPGWSLTEDELLQLIRAGIDGIETVHPAHDEARTAYYRGIASTYFLLETGGSDFHGGKRDDDANFGNVTVTSAVVDAMKLRLFIQ